MPDCPLAEDCPAYSERIQGMGCQYYGDRSGAEWCNHYNQPIRDLKSQPVKPGEEVLIDVTDIHESGAGVGRTEDGFIVLVDGVLPDARALVKIKTVRSNHATAEEILEKMPLPDEDEEDDETPGSDDDDRNRGRRGRRESRRERLGSRDNFWGS